MRCAYAFALTIGGKRYDLNQALGLRFGLRRHLPVGDQPRRLNIDSAPAVAGAEEVAERAGFDLQGVLSLHGDGGVIGIAAVPAVDVAGPLRRALLRARSASCRSAPPRPWRSTRDRAHNRTAHGRIVRCAPIPCGLRSASRRAAYRRDRRRSACETFSDGRGGLRGRARCSDRCFGLRCLDRRSYRRWQRRVTAAARGGDGQWLAGRRRGRAGRGRLRPPARVQEQDRCRCRCAGAAASGVSS